MSSSLKRLREATGLSAYAFAVEVGIAGQYYYRLELGKHDMQTKTAVKVARVLAKHLKRTPASVLADLTQINEKEKPQLETVAV